MNERGRGGDRYTSGSEGLERLGLRSASVSEVMRYMLHQNSDLRELVDDKKDLIEVQKLLEKSPQFYILRATEISYPPELTNLNRWLFSKRGKLLPYEELLFDKKLTSSGILFPPFDPPLEVKKKIWARGKANYKAGKQRGDKFSELGYRTQDNLLVYETKYRPPLSEQDVLNIIQNPSDVIRLLTGSKPLTNQEMHELLVQAGYSVLEKVAGTRLLMVRKQPLHVLSINKANDYTNPDLLIAEELKDRGYDTRIFRVVALGDLDDIFNPRPKGEVSIFGDKNASEAFETLTSTPERKVLRVLSDPLSFGDIDIEHWKQGRGDPPLRDAWRDAQFNEEEKNKLQAFILNKYVILTHKNLAASFAPRARENYREELVKAEQRLKGLGVSPITEGELRNMISRVLDREGI